MKRNEIEAAENYLESLKFKFKITAVERRVGYPGIETTIEGLIFSEDNTAITGEFTFHMRGAGIPIPNNALPAPKGD